MSSSEYVVSPAVFRELDVIREAIEQEILDDPDYGLDGAVRHARYKGLCDCLSYIKMLTLGFEEGTAAARERLVYNGLLTHLDEEDEED